MEFVVGIARCNEPRALLEETLEALRASRLPPSQILIVDNGDEPLHATPHAVPYTAVRPERNVGCAGGWNMLCDLAGDTSIVLLNSDCAVAPDTFERMYDAPEPALVCALGFSCFRLDSAIRKQIGPFDEEFYPAYFEDADYRRRCSLGGVEIIDWPYEPECIVSPGRTRFRSGIVHGWYEPGSYHGWAGDKFKWFHERLEANRLRYIAKWGGVPNAETYRSPFDERRD